MDKIRKKVTVEIDSSEIVSLLVNALATMKKDESSKPLWCVLGYLVGRSDVEAVKFANVATKKAGRKTVTVAQFRKWLPGILSQAFGEFMAEKRDG